MLSTFLQNRQSVNETMSATARTIQILTTGGFGLFYKLSPCDKNTNELCEADAKALLDNIYHAIMTLDGWVNFYDFLLFLVPVFAALAVGISDILKIAIARGMGTTDDENTAASITLDSVVGATPIITAFVVAVIKYMRDKHLGNREVLDQSREMMLELINSAFSTELDNPVEAEINLNPYNPH